MAAVVGIATTTNPVITIIMVPVASVVIVLIVRIAVIPVVKLITALKKW